MLALGGSPPKGKRGAGRGGPTPRFTVNDILLEPVVSSRAADYLVTIIFIVWLFFNVVGQPREQLKHLACPHFSEFEWIYSGEEVA